MGEKALLYIAILSGLLIAAVYYIGVTTDTNAAKSFVTSVINSVTGRNPAGGPFMNYPTTQKA